MIAYEPLQQMYGVGAADLTLGQTLPHTYQRFRIRTNASVYVPRASVYVPTLPDVDVEKTIIK